MQLKITIDQPTLFAEAKMLSSFEGKHEYNEKGDSLYDVIKVLEQDRPLFERYSGEAIKNLTKVLREFVAEVSANVITCVMPKSFNPAFENDVSEAARDYIVNFSFFLYLKMRNEARAKDYLELANQDLTDIREKVYYRTKPTKKLWNGTEN